MVRDAGGATPEQFGALPPVSKDVLLAVASVSSSIKKKTSYRTYRTYPTIRVSGAHSPQRISLQLSVLRRFHAKVILFIVDSAERTKSVR